MTTKLTQRNVLKVGPGRYTDVPTLTLFVTDTSRSWVQRLTVDGRRLDRGLGSAHRVTLAEARRIAMRNRYAARAGRNPFDEVAKSTTFANAAAAFVRANAEWSAATLKSWTVTLRKHLLPRLGATDVRKVDRLAVVNTLTAISGLSARQQTKERAQAVMAFALARGWITVNPVENGSLDASFPELKRRKTTHHAALPYAEAPALFARLTAAGTVKADCLTFLLLTGARSGEARGARWSEVGLAGKVWTVPADRMKATREHRVPLSDAALAVLARRQHDGGEGLVFPSSKGAILHPETVSRVLGTGAGTVHGLRSTFTDWAGERTEHAHEVIQSAIAHVNGNQTARAYARSDLFDRRRPLMDAWAAYIAG